VSVAKTQVLVLGAGLTGLSATWHLRRSGVACRLLEREHEPGGHARTSHVGGYRFDRTGHLLHLADPTMRDEVLALVDDEVLELERRSRVYSHGVYTRYPFQANTHGLPPEIAYACVMGFLEVDGREPARAPENFEEYCLAHFGAGMTEHFMAPYNEKLWGVPLREITAAWCQRFVPRPRRADVIAGAVGLHDRELGYNARFLYPKHGIGALPRGLARAVGAIELGRQPVAIDWRRKVVDLGDERVSYRALVSTLPLDALVRLLVDAPDEVRAAGSRLRCQSLQYLDVALQAPARVDWHWAYVPEPRLPFYRVGCYSNFSPAVAPAGCSSLYVELATRAPLDEAEALRSALPGLIEMGVVESERDVAFARLCRLEHAYVVFDHEYYGALEVLRPFFEAADIETAGRYGAWNYSSMEDALRMGRDAAREVTGRLAT
jgi:protoporphyrinogen oxidase